VLLMKRDYESIHDVLTSPSLLAIAVGGVMVLTALLGVVAAAASKLWPLRVVRNSHTLQTIYLGHTLQKLAAKIDSIFPAPVSGTCAMPDSTGIYRKPAPNRTRFYSKPETGVHVTEMMIYNRLLFIFVISCK